MIRRRHLLAAPALLAGPLMAQERKVVRAVPIGDLRQLDPIWTTAYITRNHGYMVWDTLFALDAQNRPQPQMVQEWGVSPDGLSWEFALRPGLFWHDETPVRAADCVASIRRWAGKDGMGRALLGAAESLEALDARRFRLKLKQPVGFVLEALGKIDSAVPFMMPERLALTDPNTQIMEVIGSGPFRFARGEWVPGAKVVYEKFARYQPRAEPPSQAAGGKVVKIDRVEMLYTPDAATATSGLLTGELDVLESPAPDLIERMQRSPDVVVTPNDPLGYQLFCVINHTIPPFDKVEARRALLHVLSQSDHMQATVGERTPWRECAAVFGCGPAEDAQRAAMGWPAFDPARGAALLRASGYDGRPIVVLDPADNSTLHPNALVLADAVQKLGARVDLQAMDWATLINRRASRAPAEQGGWNLFITNATLTGIANPLLNNYVRQCDEAWYGWPCDPRIPELTREWTFEADPARRHDLLKRIERLHIDDVTQVPLGQYRSFIAHRKSLRGLLPGPALFYWNIEKT